MIHKELNYTVIIERDSESGEYIATVPAFDGCVAQMKTYGEALKEIRAVLKDFIQEYIKDKIALPDEDLAVTNVRIAI